MKNLLTETLETLEANNKTVRDVIWVGTVYAWTTWDNFEAIADIEYDEGFGSSEVAEDLLVVGENWWLERHDYDGSEWWEYKELPTQCKNCIELKAVTISQAEALGFDVNCGWENLSTINNWE
jgi:hypothetical protein